MHDRGARMGAHLSFSPASKALFREGSVFDARRLEWKTADGHPSDAVPVTPVEAVRRVCSEGDARRLPVGMIGPRDALPEDRELAERVAALLTQLGFQIVCGGRSGVMEAACRGARRYGGMPIGILPDSDWRTANDHVSIPLATGMGEARNAIIATACFAVIAVGGGYGTLSEMALGLRLGRLVIAMPGAHQVDGAVCGATPEEAIDLVARRFLRID